MAKLEYFRKRRRAVLPTSTFLQFAAPTRQGEKISNKTVVENGGIAFNSENKKKIESDRDSGFGFISVYLFTIYTLQKKKEKNRDKEKKTSLSFPTSHHESPHCRSPVAHTNSESCFRVRMRFKGDEWGDGFGKRWRCWDRSRSIALSRLRDAGVLYMAVDQFILVESGDGFDAVDMHVNDAWCLVGKSGEPEVGEDRDGERGTMKSRNYNVVHRRDATYRNELASHP
ncbi:hypothetical protein BC829DRAFT_481947 [Chytridium lagenaria]|nr:hypothetical protein BC829DRAFT_481947 [Chytridium lagenaria]